MNSKQDKEKENPGPVKLQNTKAQGLILKADGAMTVTPTPDSSMTRKGATVTTTE